MNVGDYIYLRKDGIRERELALMELLNVGRGELFTMEKCEISESKLLEIDKKISEGVPLYYALGEIIFYGRKFFVGEGVLIPRLESELVLEKALSLIPEDKSLKILDLCTGSGVLGISLAKEKPKSSVLLSDIDDTALSYAKKNIELNEARHCSYVKSDLFENIDEKFDIIISNPPYIPSDDIPGLETSVRDYEPITALDGGKTGLDFYEKILEKIDLFLFSGGFFVSEIGYNQGESLLKLAPGAEVYKDFQGNDRIFLLKY